MGSPCQRQPGNFEREALGARGHGDDARPIGPERRIARVTRVKAAARQRIGSVASAPDSQAGEGDAEAAPIIRFRIERGGGKMGRPDFGAIAMAQWQGEAAGECGAGQGFGGAPIDDDGKIGDELAGKAACVGTGE